MSITGWLQFGMRQSAEVENLMTSVERNVEYANLSSEAPLESTPGKRIYKMRVAGLVLYKHPKLIEPTNNIIRNH